MPRLIPFWQYYFQFYKANKRLVVLELLTKHRTYDKKLFKTFVRQIDGFINKDKKLFSKFPALDIPVLK